MTTIPLETAEKLVEIRDGNPTLDEAVQRLAALPELEYEKVRTAEAKRLEVRARVLDRAVAAARGGDDGGGDLGLHDPDPWSEPVEGAKLLDRLVAGIKTYVVLPDHAATAAALWTVHAHCFATWRHTPRLSVTAPEKGCGKSTLLDVLCCLVPRALKTENLSTAAMFRVVDGHRPTLLIDEVDSYLIGRNTDEELRSCLNAGHTRNGRHLRCEGENNTVKAFKTFAPAALAGIGTLPGTLADRSIRIVLNRRKPTEQVADFREDRAGRLHELASMAARWTQDHARELADHEPVMPEGIHNRAADNWRPLLAIADAAGGDWPARAREAAKALTEATSDDTESLGVLLLADLKVIFEDQGATRLSSTTISEELAKIEERPWPEYGRSGKPISPRQLARLLAPFGIVPNKIRLGDTTLQGYRLDQFVSAFTRYLVPETEHRNEPQNFAENEGFPNGTSNFDVPFENGRKPKDSATWSGVPAENQGNRAHTFSNQHNVDPDDPATFMDEPVSCCQCGRPIPPD
jgi:putative DNA primase/helicase